MRPSGRTEFSRGREGPIHLFYQQKRGRTGPPERNCFLKGKKYKVTRIGQPKDPEQTLDHLFLLKTRSSAIGQKGGLGVKFLNTEEGERGASVFFGGEPDHQEMGDSREKRGLKNSEKRVNNWGSRKSGGHQANE